jgi:hypothetical protein
MITLSWNTCMLNVPNFTANRRALNFYMPSESSRVNSRTPPLTREMEQPLLKLYDQRLFTLLKGLRRSPLLSLLGSDIFNQILKHSGPWQTCTQVQWKRKDALKEWLRFKTRSLLILGIKPYKPPNPAHAWHPSGWQAA